MDSRESCAAVSGSGAGEQEESLCRNCISQLKDIRLQLEGCETRTVHRIRLPLDKDPAKECTQRINDQQVSPPPPRAGKKGAGGQP